MAIRAAVSVIEPAIDGKTVRLVPRMVTAIPYYIWANRIWANRGSSPMQVWLPNRIWAVTISE